MNHHYLRTILWAAILMMAGITLQAQGWQRTYPDNTGTSVAFDVKPTADGGYILVGETDFPTGAPRHYVRLMKVDAAGHLQWDKNINEGAIGEDEGREIWTNNLGYIIGGATTYAPAATPQVQHSFLLMQTDANGDTLWTRRYNGGGAFSSSKAYALHATADGGYIMAGEHRPSQQGGSPGPQSAMVVKTDANGQLQWLKLYASGNSPNYIDGLRDIRPTSDGGYIAAGVRSNKTLLMKLDANGDTLWTHANSITTSSRAYSVQETPDGGYIVGGSSDGFAGAGAYIMKTDALGNELWVQYLSSGAGATTEIELLPDGDFIATGSLTSFWGSNTILGGAGFLSKIAADGTVAWSRSLQPATLPNPSIISYQGSGVLPTADGGYLVAGQAVGDAWLIKTNGDGFSVSNWITGTVYRSTTCLTDDIVMLMKNWKVKLTGNGETRYATTDDSGSYTFLVDTGFYSLEVIPENLLWTNCNGAVTFQLTNFFDTTYHNLQVAALAECPLMTVDIGAGILRRCVNNHYSVQYCNEGTLAAEDAYVEVLLDPYLTLVEASVPYIPQGGGVYRFTIGDVAMGDCGSFTFKAYLDCNNTVLGQTHCVTAHIYPDTLCLPNPSQPYIDIAGQCLGNNTVRFTLSNIGEADMPNSAFYIVIEDDVMYMPEPFDLGAGESINIDLPANGSTFRLEADLVPGSFDDQATSATVEGCGTNLNGVFSTGFVNQFSLNDNTSFEDINCRASVGSYDPNDKQAFPVGYADLHYIKANTPIEYLIRFQNTGTDTAFQVTLRDTLSRWLDPATVEPGASSHPYRWELIEHGVMVFHFDNILLPDSTTNLEASQGWVRFTVAQQEDNEIGTLIENNAAIYFDFNAPVITNTTYHTIGDDFVPTDTNNPGIQHSSLQCVLMPNPAGSVTHLLIEGPAIEGVLGLWDARGVQVLQQNIQGNTTNIDVSRLPRGLYFYRIESSEGKVAVGKLGVE